MPPKIKANRTVATLDQGGGVPFHGSCSLTHLIFAVSMAFQG